MINKLLLQITLCISFLISSQTNISGIVKYESIPNTVKINKSLSEKEKKTKNKKLLSLIKRANNYSSPIKSKLIFNKMEGLFFVESKLLNDSKNFAHDMAVLRAGGSKEYYYNQENKVFLIKECEALGECFIFDNKYLKWNLTQETKKINNYTVYKATRNNNKVIGWYTPQIPLGLGPKGEYGLPGLILELEIGKVIFKATKITLNPKEKVKISKPRGGKRVSFEEYSNYIKKAKKNIFGNQ